MMKSINVAEKSNSMDVNISDKQLVFMILQARPPKYRQLKVSCNTQNNNWTVDELVSQCVQKENREKQENGKEVDAVNLLHAERGKKGTGTNGASGKSSNSSKNSSKSAKTTESSKTLIILKLK